MWQLAVGEESRVNDPNTRTTEVLGQVPNLEPRTEQTLLGIPPMNGNHVGGWVVSRLGVTARMHV